jgi:hypothetical protein
VQGVYYSVWPAARWLRDNPRRLKQTSRGGVQCRVFGVCSFVGTDVYTIESPPRGRVTRDGKPGA